MALRVEICARTQLANGNIHLEEEERVDVDDEARKMNLLQHVATVCTIDRKYFRREPKATDSVENVEQRGADANLEKVTAGHGIHGATCAKDR